MTTPSELPPVDPAQQAADQQAQHDAEVDAQLRQLASEIAKQSKLDYDPATIRKATVTAISSAIGDATSTPPTVSLQISGDTSTTVSAVRTLNNFSPQIGQTVLLTKQGSEIFILGGIAGTNAYSTAAGWTDAMLAAGSHGGNSNGNVMYRRVLDNGSWKMQWRGGWAVSGTTLVAVGGMPVECRPSSKRSVLAAREILGGSVAVQFDFKTDGSITLVGGTTAPNYTDNDNVSFNTNSSTVTWSGSDVTSNQNQNHTHTTSGVVSSGANVGHSHSYSWGGSDSHSHFVPSGTHHHNNSVSVSSPGWVSLNGVEYFL